MTVRSPISAPKTRPVFPRINSGTSGFFFWGMIELPVAWASGSLTKWNSALDQRISSSQSLERCIIVMLAAARNSRAKSLSLTASSELAASSAKPSNSAVRCRSMGKPVPASAPAPRGETSSR